MEIKMTIIWTALAHHHQMSSLATKSDRKTLTHINLEAINISVDTTKQFIYKTYKTRVVTYLIPKTH